MALLGGAVLILLIAVTCLSIIGRSLNTIGHSDFVETSLSAFSDVLKSFGPIVGDFEIVEAGVAFAIMAFIPLCQLTRGHAKVELLTAFLPLKFNRFLAFIWELIFAIVLIVIAWRLYVGTTDKLRYGETTFMLQFPVWWGYAACTFAAFIAAFVGIYSLYLHFNDLKSEPSGLEKTVAVAEQEDRL